MDIIIFFLVTIVPKKKKKIAVGGNLFRPFLLNFSNWAISLMGDNKVYTRGL